MQDPLSKPEWPSLDPDTGDTAAGLLGNLIAPLANIDPAKIPDLYENVLVGFNSVMAGIEEHAKGGRKMYAICVCRGDLPSEMCFPFALSSSALGIKLVSLPKGSRGRLSGSAGREAGIIGLRDGDFGALKETLKDVGSAKTDWAYISAPAAPKKAPKGSRNASKQGPKQGPKKTPAASNTKTPTLSKTEQTQTPSN